MKKRMKAVVALIFALVGVQNAFASLNCDGTVYFLLPDDWRSAYIVSTGMSTPMVKGPGNWLSLSADEIAGSNIGSTFYIEETGQNNCNDGHCVRRDSMNVLYMRIDAGLFTCDDFGSTGELWISAHPDPSKENVTYFGNEKPEPKYFFFMPPETFEWYSAVPMLSKDGGKTGVPMRAVESRCGWYSYMFFNEDITNDVVIYRDDADVNPVTGIHEDAVGLNGDWETRSTPTPIPLQDYFGMIEDSDSLFFVASEDQKSNSDGFYYTAAEIDGIIGNCDYLLASLIYDTDASLHPSFSCWVQGGEGCQQGAQNISLSQALAAFDKCKGVHAGMVESSLDPTTKKPTLSTKGKECFFNADIFNELFNYTKKVNEVRCYDMPLHRTAENKWLFDSDYMGIGGFYPVEEEPYSGELVSASLPAARTKYNAQGPIFFGPVLREQDADEGFRKIDVLCKGPGWSDGMDCEGLFADADKTTTAVSDALGVSQTYFCMFGWSCPEKAPKDWTFFEAGTETVVDRKASGASPRWEGKRNSHFCYESHAKFTYKPGQKFSFVSKDDAWVFIDNELAVDLGGMHLPAPGYVDLEKFTGASGKLNAGDNYDIDIFFCNRESSASAIRINTNMYMTQKVPIEVKKSKNETSPTETSYEICYNESGDGSCAVGQPSEDNLTCCGNDFKNKDGCRTLTLSYSLVKGKNITDPAVPMSGVEDATSVPGIYHCGIDLTNLSAPVVDPANICGLGVGRYSLFVKIGSRARRLTTFYVDGSVDVVSADAIAYDANGEFMRTYKVVQEAVAGEMVPVYVSTVSESDAADDPLAVFPEEAAGAEYTLEVSSNLLKVYHKDITGSYVSINPASSRKIGDSGVDTVYVTVAAEDLAEAVQEFSVGVKTGKLTLPLSFSLPRVYPVPVPVFADVFDARGASPAAELSISKPYFSVDNEYLDGIADSVAVYYSRAIHKDSLPSYLCVEWDSESAEKFNPYEMAISSIMSDKLIRCNELVKLDAQNVDCSGASKNGGYCSNIVTVGGLALSSDVKTAGTGKVISYAEFKDKGKTIKEGFTGVLIDRVAPVPLSAEIHTITEDGKQTDYDTLVVTLSEPVKLVTTTYKKSALDFYLNSLTGVKDKKRYVSSLKNTSTQVNALATPTISMLDGKGRVKYLYNRAKASPRVGDYVRLGGDMNEAFWVDTAETDLQGADTLRSKNDAAYSWNSPTGYDAEKRLPSPWVVIEGDGKNDEPEEDEPILAHTPGFRTIKIGSSQFAIVVGAAAVGKTYAVMDLQGGVLCQGSVASTETVVPVLAAGSYVVKVGNEIRRVNLR